MATFAHLVIDLATGNAYKWVGDTLTQIAIFETADETKLDGVAAGADVTGSNAPQAHESTHVSGGSDDIDAALNPAAVALTTRGDILFHGASGLARLAKGTATHVLTMGADDPAWAAGSGALEYAAGDVLVSSADTAIEGGALTASYVKYKEFQIATSGTLRIKFDIQSTTASRGIKARIYRNGGAVGTEQTIEEAAWTTFSEDLAGWSNGDLCQLYCKYIDAASTNSGWRNFRLYGTAPLYDMVVNLDT